MMITLSLISINQLVGKQLTVYSSSNGLFKEDHRGISLALCVDGLNPFAHNRVSYPLWPIM